MKLHSVRCSVGFAYIEVVKRQIKQFNRGLKHIKLQASDKLDPEKPNPRKKKWGVGATNV